MLRLLTVWQVVPEVTLFFGPSLNVYVGEGANRLRDRPGYIDAVHTSTNEANDLHVEVWPGFALGLSLL